MFSSPFDVSPSIPKDCKVVFVADLFQEDYLGGAELTSGALIDSSPVPILKVHSRNLTAGLIEQGRDKHWIFGNFAMMDFSLIPMIIERLDYSMLEYDYKFCRYRSPEKHQVAEASPCDCQNHDHGRMISAFMKGSKMLWFMSERQRDTYTSRFSTLKDSDHMVLSSVFGEDFFNAVNNLRLRSTGSTRSKWLVLGSDSWIKGSASAIAWCRQNDKEYEVISGLSYEQVLSRMSTAEGFVYLPPGGDTCPRMVTEARLLGCQLILNENVQHAQEEWFNNPDLNYTLSWLYNRRRVFWSRTLELI